MIEIKTYTYKHILVAEIQGNLDSQCSQDIQAWFEEKIKGGYIYLALDFLDIDFVSSLGIGVLFDLSQTIKNLKGRLVVFNLNSDINNLLLFLKLNNHLIIAKNAEEAMKELEHIPTNMKHKIEELAEENVEASKQQEGTDKQKEEVNKRLKQESPKNQVNQKKPKKEEEFEILNCPYCKKRMKLKKEGKYLCPHCNKALEYS